jgi:anti-sigma-K factor RskA
MSTDVENHVTDLLPAYVLEILTADESNQVSSHLSSCEICQSELARLQVVVDDLPLAAAQHSPSPALKNRLMTQVHSRKIGATATGRNTFGRRKQVLFGQPLLVFSLLLVVALAVINGLLWRQLVISDQQASTSFRVVPLANTQFSPGTVGTLIMDSNGKYGTLVVDNLATLDPGKQYQVWLVKGADRISGGVFSVNPDGYASLEIKAPLPLIQYDSIGVSVEPTGGSPAPTGDRVLGGNLAK